VGLGSLTFSGDIADPSTENKEEQLGGRVMTPVVGFGTVKVVYCCYSQKRIVSAVGTSMTSKSLKNM